MMVKCITLEHPDGSISTRGGLGPKMLARFNGDVDAALQHILNDLVPIQNPGLVARIEDVTFPADKTFRNAWKRGVGKIEIDMPKARVIHTTRVENAKRVKARDLVERDMMGENVTVEKAALRAIDVQVQINAATAPEALGAIWPAGIVRS